MQKITIIDHLVANPSSCFSGRAGFSDLNPPDGGWSQNPAGTVIPNSVKKVNLWTTCKAEFFPLFTQGFSSGNCAVLETAKSAGKKLTPLFSPREVVAVDRAWVRLISALMGKVAGVALVVAAGLGPAATCTRSRTWSGARDGGKISSSGTDLPFSLPSSSLWLLSYQSSFILLLDTLTLIQSTTCRDPIRLNWIPILDRGM